VLVIKSFRVGIAVPAITSLPFDRFHYPHDYKSKIVLILNISVRWTEVHPRLMSVPELTRVLAKWWLRVDEVLHEVTRTRASNRAKVISRLN